MIIFGHRARVGEPKPLPGAVCKSCTKGNLSLVTIFRYFHIYWIPFFPLARNFAAVCDHCQKHYSHAELKEFQTAFGAGNLKFDPIPKNHFAGLALAMCIVAAFVVSAQRETENTKMYAANPQAGDICVIKTKAADDPKHTLHAVWEILAVDNNEVRFHEGSLGFSLPSQAEKFALTRAASMKDGYRPETMAIDRAEFLKMLEKGDLEKIVRLGSKQIAPSSGLPSNTLQANLDAH